MTYSTIGSHHHVHVVTFTNNTQLIIDRHTPKGANKPAWLVLLRELRADGGYSQSILSVQDKHAMALIAFNAVMSLAILSGWVIKTNVKDDD